MCWTVSALVPCHNSCSFWTLAPFAASICIFRTAYCWYKLGFWIRSICSNAPKNTETVVNWSCEIWSLTNIKSSCVTVSENCIKDQKYYTLCPRKKEATWILSITSPSIEIFFFTIFEAFCWGIIRAWHSVAYHRLRGSGSTVVKMTSKVNGETEISPCIWNPWKYWSQTWSDWLRHGLLQPCQFLWKSVQGGLLLILVKYNLLVTLCTFPSFFSCRRLQQKRVDGFSRCIP